MTDTTIFDTTTSAQQNEKDKGTLASGLILRPAEERGASDFGWLKANFSFSFANYYDPRYMGFESLRVINDDLIAPDGKFPMHPHDNMEIFTYVVSGAIQHEDSMGNGSTVSAGGVQYMSAGTGVRHSEANPSSTDPLRSLQIWILPNVVNATPRYDTMDIDPKNKDGRLKLFLSPDGRNGSMTIRADVDIYAATLNGDQTIVHDMGEGRRGWIQVANGALSVNGEALRRGDGLAIKTAGRLIIEQGEDAEFLYFEFR